MLEAPSTGVKTAGVNTGVQEESLAGTGWEP